MVTHASTPPPQAQGLDWSPPLAGGAKKNKDLLPNVWVRGHECPRGGAATQTDWRRTKKENKEKGTSSDPLSLPWVSRFSLRSLLLFLAGTYDFHPVGTRKVVHT